MKVFISADIEGTAGIADWDEALKERRDYSEFRELMTAEVVAACEGARAAGAKEILIKDAHQSARNLIVSKLPDYASIVRGWSGHPHVMMFGLDRSFDAALFTGYHAKAGTESNPLAHTMNDRISRLVINGEVASEFTVNAFTAALLGVAPVFLSGDRGICDDARALVPGIGTVAVSEGFGRATLSMSPARAMDQIREGVEKALSRDLTACRLDLPKHFDVEIEFNNPTDAYRASWYPGAEHPRERTLRFVSDNYFEVLRALRFLTV
ncbi:M55 family metallopeptidase [Mesorhizobium sp. PAMC28654]|uniref:M55 family metallopeptidase n=1 Tax=Mesorhizobium sp. PAMC28654 TaxID=2880934 RepID=UPI001D0A227A|nr:M55 family metallopeptidase [Mesorhizobium sp. PAMC28654]UDL88901.1 M55 family metallopeptidase [Mesorhizobium sp. PAMC28654]